MCVCSAIGWGKHEWMHVCAATHQHWLVGTGTKWVTFGAALPPPLAAAACLPTPLCCSHTGCAADCCEEGRGCGHPLRSRSTTTLGRPSSDRRLVACPCSRIRLHHRTRRLPGCGAACRLPARWCAAGAVPVWPEQDGPEAAGSGRQTGATHTGKGGGDVSARGVCERVLCEHMCSMEW